MRTTANGKDVVSATVHLPRAGVWHAELAVDTQTPADVTGVVAIALADGALTLQGTAVGAPTLWRGLTRLRVVAGAAGMGTQLAPSAYAQGTPARVIIGDILGGAGEKASASIAPATLSTTLQAWARIAQSAGTALSALASKLGAVWRAMPDGTIWLGAEAWPASSITDYSVTDLAPVDGRMEIVMATPTLLPGTTLSGAKVGRVIHRLESHAVRTEVFFE